MTSNSLTLTSSHSAATTYSFHGEHGWALCTVNDRTGELLITSDWGSWSYRWNVRHLGAPTLTAFLSDRSSVDYLARKLQSEGNTGRQFSAAKTCAALRRRLCEQRLEEGRDQIEGRLEKGNLDDLGRVPNRFLGRYDARGLPLFSSRRIAAPTWSDPARTEPLPYLSRDKARQIWDALGDLADEFEGLSVGDMFWERLPQIDGFTDYVTDTPYEYAETEQTFEDKILREAILPALIEACRAEEQRRVLATWFTTAPQPPDVETMS